MAKNSKNLLVQDRNVREAYHDKIITSVHIVSKRFATDLNARPTWSTDFIARRAVLLNIAANPAFAKYLYIPGPSSYTLSPYLCTVSIHYSDDPHQYEDIPDWSVTAGRPEDRVRKLSLKDPEKISRKFTLKLYIQLTVQYMYCACI